MKYWMLMVLGGILSVNATTWRPDDRLLAAVRQIESSNGAFTYGDAGKSLGDFQLSEAAWVDVSSWRKERGLPTYHYDRYVLNAKVNRTYAKDYLTLIHMELSRKLKRPPHAGELYAAYNMGMAEFASCDYKLARVNPVTARKCSQIRKMVGERLR